MDGKVDAVSTWEPWISAARQALDANSVAFYPERGFGFGFHLAGRNEFVRAHPATMQKMLRALLRAERFLNEQPQAARAVLIAAAKADPAVFDSTRPNFSLQLTFDQRLLTMLEDQARWAAAGGLIDAAAAPNFLDALYLDAMLAVNPQAVSIVH